MKFPVQDFIDGPVVKTLPFNAEGVSLIPGWGAKTPHASWPESQNVKEKRYCNKFNKDFKKSKHTVIIWAGIIVMDIYPGGRKLMST